ncbi:MAG: hypothetical protein IJ736_02825, partial [Firmicutes bacterium]|nr:hypothetical protein [Bacillota bacterium]
YNYFYSINKIIKHIYGLEITPQEFDAILTMIEEVFNELFLIVQSQGSKAQYNDVLVSYISGFYSTKNLMHERGNALLDRDILNYCFTMTGYEWEGYKYIEYGKVFHDSIEKRGLKITEKNFLFEDLIDVLNTPSILSLFKNDIYNIESEKISLMFELSKEVFSFRQND